MMALKFQVLGEEDGLGPQEFYIGIWGCESPQWRTVAADQHLSPPFRGMALENLKWQEK